jgi:predicted nucleic acid-binding protein
VIVVDGAALVDYLVRHGDGEWVEERLVEDQDHHAPHLIDVEVANGLRNLSFRGSIDVARAEAALSDLSLMRLTRYAHSAFLERIWALRSNLTAYHAAYVALAEVLEAPLVTTDRRLARSPGLPVEVIVPTR